MLTVLARDRRSSCSSPGSSSGRASRSASRRWRTSSSPRCPQSDVGIATGINTIMRTAGGAFGSAAVTAILAGSATGVRRAADRGRLHGRVRRARSSSGCSRCSRRRSCRDLSAKPVGVGDPGRRRVVGPRAQAQLQARAAGRAQLAVHRLGQPARDREPETRAGAALRVGAADPPVEEPLAAGVGQPGTLVLDGDDRAVALAPQRDGDRPAAVDAGVVDKDPQDPQDGGAVGQRVDRAVGIQLEGDVVARAAGRARRARSPAAADRTPPSMRLRSSRSDASVTSRCVWRSAPSARRRASVPSSRSSASSSRLPCSVASGVRSSCEATDRNSWRSASSRRSRRRMSSSARATSPTSSPTSSTAIGCSSPSSCRARASSRSRRMRRSTPPEASAASTPPVSSPMIAASGRALRTAAAAARVSPSGLRMTSVTCCAAAGARTRADDRVVAHDPLAHVVAAGSGAVRALAPSSGSVSASTRPSAPTQARPRRPPCGAARDDAPRAGRARAQAVARQRADVQARRPRELAQLAELVALEAVLQRRQEGERRGGERRDARPDHARTSRERRRRGRGVMPPAGTPRRGRSRSRPDRRRPR